MNRFHECNALKPDLSVCRSYMDNYFAQVQHWADRHREPMSNQYGKVSDLKYRLDKHVFVQACKLLNAVPHVPTLCCQIFRQTCDAHLQ